MGSRILVSVGSEKAISEIETIYGIALPIDFRTYLLECNPPLDNLDHNATYWWPIARLKSVRHALPSKLDSKEFAVIADDHLVFADYMVGAWIWAICCRTGPDFGCVVQLGRGCRVVANSFAEFIDAYVANRDDLF